MEERVSVDKNTFDTLAIWHHRDSGEVLKHHRCVCSEEDVEGLKKHLIKEMKRIGAYPAGSAQYFKDMALYARYHKNEAENSKNNAGKKLIIMRMAVDATHDTGSWQYAYERMCTLLGLSATAPDGTKAND